MYLIRQLYVIVHEPNEICLPPDHLTTTLPCCPSDPIRLRRTPLSSLPGFPPKPQIIVLLEELRSKGTLHSQLFTRQEPCTSTPFPSKYDQSARRYCNPARIGEKWATSTGMHIITLSSPITPLSRPSSRPPDEVQGARGFPPCEKKKKKSDLSSSPPALSSLALLSCKKGVVAPLTR